MVVPLPAGFRIKLDPSARQVAVDTWVGGSPARVVRLTAAGQAAFAELRGGPVASRNSAVIARRLTDAGLAHPRPPALTAIPGVTVVVPARDRVDLLNRCLGALGQEYPVLVVDDGSRDPAAVAAVVRRHRAVLVRRPVNGGAGPARNTGLAHVDTDIVAFVDSDCQPTGDWIAPLLPHFADPLVAAVAPRMTGELDMGELPARVQPNTRVPYVPTAALLVRRSALATVGTFDEGIGRGEDADLVWRLHEAGLRIRYDPAVVVRHNEPTTRIALARRRFRYGRSAAPLAIRHPAAAPQLVLYPWPTAVVLALLARRPVVAAIASAGSLATTVFACRRAGLPVSDAPMATASAVGRTWLAISRYLVRFAAPALVAGVIAPGRRIAAASLLFSPAVVTCLERRSGNVLDSIAGDIAYGTGVLAGCVSARTLAPIRPSIANPDANARNAKSR